MIWIVPAAILVFVAVAEALWVYEWRALRRESRALTQRQDRELRELRGRREGGVRR